MKLSEAKQRADAAYMKSGWPKPDYFEAAFLERTSFDMSICSKHKDGFSPLVDVIRQMEGMNALNTYPGLECPTDIDGLKAAIKDYFYDTV